MGRVTTITKKHCPWCGTEIGKINGVLANTFYCRNYECFYPGYSELTTRAISILGAPNA